jgi:hypothetical protein
MPISTSLADFCRAMAARPNSPPVRSRGAPAAARDDGGWECPICLASLRDPVVTPCGHLLCWPCIWHWLKHSVRCPVCHSPVDASRLVPVYGHGAPSPPARDRGVPPRPRAPALRPARPWNPGSASPFEGDFVSSVVGIILLLIAWYAY